MSHLSCKCNSHFRQCRQFSPFLLRDQLFPLCLRLLWYFKLIADIIATTSVDATSGKNLWYVDCTSCCSDTTLVWNRTRPPSYCPNTSQLYISHIFSKCKKQILFCSSPTGLKPCSSEGFCLQLILWLCSSCWRLESRAEITVKPLPDPPLWLKSAIHSRPYLQKPSYTHCV